MPDLDEQGRPTPPSAGDEAETLVGFLEFQRATFAWKCRGLDDEGLRARVSPSSLTLGGLMKHLALVEDWWFGQWLWDLPADAAFAGVDFDADPEWDFRTAGADPADELWALWSHAVDAARDRTRRALSERGLGGLALRSGERGQAPSLRWILCHMVEEYARHNGHADFLRESVDGETGE